MSNDDEAARKARARRLRDQIDQIAKGEPEAEKSEQESPPAGSESPREFVHRRMRELDKKDRA